MEELYQQVLSKMTVQLETSTANEKNIETEVVALCDEITRQAKSNEKQLSELTIASTKYNDETASTIKAVNELEAIVDSLNVSKAWSRSESSIAETKRYEIQLSKAQANIDAKKIEWVTLKLNLEESLSEAKRSHVVDQAKIEELEIELDRNEAESKIMIAELDLSAAEEQEKAIELEKIRSVSKLEWYPSVLGGQKLYQK